MEPIIHTFLWGSQLSIMVLKLRIPVVILYPVGPVRVHNDLLELMSVGMIP